MSHYWSVACTLYHFSSFCSSLFFGELEWRSAGINHLPPMWPGFDSRTRRHTWAEFFVGSCLCAEGFSSGTLLPVLPLPLHKKKQKNNNSIFQFDLETGDEWTKSRSVDGPLKFSFIFLYIFIITIQDLKIFKFENMHYWTVDLGSLHKRSSRTIMKLKLTYFSKRLRPSIKIRVVYSSMYFKL